MIYLNSRIKKIWNKIKVKKPSKNAMYIMVLILKKGGINSASKDIL